MVAWHAEPTLKTAALGRLREHQRMDLIVQGVYWEDGKGCNLGCLTHCNEDAHNATVRLFGFPLRIAYFLEAVFEGLPKADAPRWVIESADAIPVGADLSLFHHRFGAWLLAESGLLTITDGNREAIANVADLHRRAAAGEEVESAAWSAAESAAWSAAESAAWSAAWSAAESAAWQTIAAKGIELFRSSPVVGDCQECPEAACKSLLHLQSTALIREFATSK